jgi:hypothetical protein
MSAWVEPSFGIQVAKLVAGAINQVLEAKEKDGQDCCPQCCGPCSALAYFRENVGADQSLGHWLLQWEGVPTWDWQLPSGRVDWAQLEAAWTMTECHEE